MQENYVNEQMVADFIDDYLKNNKVNYAILINGSWGSGKTFFIKEHIIKKLDKEYEMAKENLKTLKIWDRFCKKKKSINAKKPIYVSLYGISSISDIKSKILLATIKNDKIKKLLPVLDVGAEIGNEIISKNYSISNSSGKLTRILSNFYSLENLIVFFDDLERCNVDINIVLGYINQLVEHNQLKVILIADEEKIGKLDFENNKELKYLTVLSENIDFQESEKKDILGQKIPDTGKITVDEIKKRTTTLFNENVFYNEIKEKLIGHTICFKPNISSIYETLAADIIEDIEIRKIVIEKKENLISIMNSKNYQNLRTIQFIFQVYEKLAKISLAEVDLKDYKDQYLTNLFEYIVLKAVQIKSGNSSYNWEKNQDLGVIYLGNELADCVYSNYVKGFRFVDDYLMYSYLSKKTIKKVVENYIYLEELETNNPNDPLYKLKRYWLIPEQELEQLLDEMILKIKDNEYVLNLYSKIVFYLSAIADMNICIDKVDVAVNLLEENIKNGIVNGKFEEERINLSTKDVADKYNKYIKKIRTLVDAKEHSSIQKDITNILNNDNWGAMLNEYCEKNNSKFLTDKKYAYLLDTSLIVNNIIYKDIGQIYEFLYSLKKIYNFSNIKEYYLDDITYLVNLKDALYKITDVDKVRLYVINMIISFLESVITALSD